MKIPHLPALALVIALAHPASAAQLVLWSFPTPLSGIGSGTPIAPTAEAVVGAPTLTPFNQAIYSNGLAGTAYTDSTGTNRPATANGAIAWDDFRGPGTDGELWMALDSTGFADLSLRFDIQLNDNPVDSSVRLLRVDYSTDGGTNFTFLTNLSITNNNAWSAQTVNLSSISAVEGAPNLVIRLSQGGSGDANAINSDTSFDNLEITGTGGGGPATEPVLTVSPTTTARLALATDAGGTVSGVLGDPTDPASLQGIVFSLADPDTPVGSLGFTVASSNTTVVPQANLAVTGSGANRTLRITPAAVGTSNITVTLTDPQSHTDSYLIAYAASAASSTPTVSRFHTGAADASAAVPIGTAHMLVANDEDQVLRLYERANSGQPVATFDMNATLALVKEADLEAAVRIGNRVYWIASHGNERDGDDAPARRTAFSTDLNGSGAATVAVYVNKFTGLRSDLINWDNANGHGLGAGALGLSASAAPGVLPTVQNGFNIEGAALAPGGSTILLGFRAPLQNTAQRNRALVIPATNLASVIDTGAGTVTFGAPIFLDLGGRAIRAMDTTASGQVLILAGPVDNRIAGVTAATFQLFLWDGNGATPPTPLTSNIDDIAANSAGSPEALFDPPATLMNGSALGILVDNGGTDLYGTGQEAKDLASNWQKFRADPVTISNGVPGAVTTNGDAGSGSLRQAIADAPSGGTITFATSLSGQTIPLTTGQLVLSKNLTIDASSLSGGITISGEDSSRIFDVSAGQTVTLRGLTLREGFADQGGAIRNVGGTLTVSGCTLLGNGAQYGGAIYSNTDLSTVRTTLVNSTITGNFATQAGGGVYNHDGLTEVRHCTITENAMPTGTGGGIVSYRDAVTSTTVGSSIITANASGDVTLFGGVSGNSFVSSGANLVGTGDALAAFNQTGDLTAAVPLLHQLARYGGPTDTMPPRLGSPAIDRAAASTAPTDQRGAVRPQNGDFTGGALADSGAVEFQPTVVANANNSDTGSLREAIAAPFASTVTFDPPTFNGEAADTITLSSELTLNRPLVIDGSSAYGGVVVSGNDATRVFNLGGGANVTLQSLSIVRGNSGGNTGGGILVDGGAALTVIDSLIARNATTSFGGGIMVFTGTATLLNSTLAHNTASDGGAIWCQAGPGTLRLTHNTVTANTGIYAIVNFSGMTLENSIVAGNSSNNIFDSAGSPVFIGNNFTFGDPRLLPLGNYFGLTSTMPPRPDSPAVNSAAASAVTTDQRGAPRPAAGAPEIGAVEYQPVTVTNSASTGSGSLRAQLFESFASTIHFAPGTFNGEPQDTIALASELDPYRSVHIDASGNPHGVTLSGGSGIRIFRMRSGANLLLDGLTLTGGNGTEGGAILNEGGALELNRCTLSENSAQFSGGAISNRSGSATLVQCTLANNSVTAGGVNFGGGAIFNLGTLALNHCTVSANVTATQNQGGGIINAGPATLTNCIVAGNSVGPGGVGADVLNDDGFVQGVVTRVGANLIQDYFQRNTSASSGPPAINAPPLLAPLDDYGGPTRTMALLPGSPARNNSAGSAVTTDQRGFVILSVPPDLGAYEAGNPGVYKAWAFENLPAISSRAFADDSDQDGLANGLEYAFSTELLAPNPGPLPGFIPNAPHTEADLVFPIRVAVGDLIYEIQRSTDLTSWMRIAGVDLRDGSTPIYDPAVSFLDLVGSTVIFRDPFIAGKDKVFYRLVVTGL